jgi:hypothetical protein
VSFPQLTFDQHLSSQFSREGVRTSNFILTKKNKNNFFTKNLGFVAMQTNFHPMFDVNKKNLRQGVT